MRSDAQCEWEFPVIPTIPHGSPELQTGTRRFRDIHGQLQAP